MKYKNVGKISYRIPELGITVKPGEEFEAPDHIRLVNWAWCEKAGASKSKAKTQKKE